MYLIISLSDAFWGIDQECVAKCVPETIYKSICTHQLKPSGSYFNYPCAGCKFYLQSEFECCRSDYHCSTHFCVDNICNNKEIANTTCTQSNDCPDNYYCNFALFSINKKCRAKGRKYANCWFNEHCLSNNCKWFDKCE